MAPEQVGGFIARLDEAGLLTLGPPAGSCPDEQARAYWEAAGVDAANTKGKHVQVIVITTSVSIRHLPSLPCVKRDSREAVISRLCSVTTACRRIWPASTPLTVPPVAPGCSPNWVSAQV